MTYNTKSVNKVSKVNLPSDITSFIEKHQNIKKDCHIPDCTCPVGAVVDYQLREFTNGTLHVYPYCRSCGTRAISPVKRETIPLQKWRDLIKNYTAEKEATS